MADSFKILIMVLAIFLTKRIFTKEFLEVASDLDFMSALIRSSSFLASSLYNKSSLKHLFVDLLSTRRFWCRKSIVEVLDGTERLDAVDDVPLLVDGDENDLAAIFIGAHDVTCVHSYQFNPINNSMFTFWVRGSALPRPSHKVRDLENTSWASCCLHHLVSLFQY